MYNAVVRDGSYFAVLGLSLLIFSLLSWGLPEVHIIGRVELNLVRNFNDKCTLMITQVFKAEDLVSLFEEH
jgi:hypothetical protein